MRTTLAGCAAALLLVTAGCGGSSPSSSATSTPNPNAKEVSPAGDIPDNQAYVAYAPPGTGFSVKVPEGWSRTAAGGTTSFTDKLNTVRLEEITAQRAPTASAARRSVPSGKVSTVKRTAGTAIRITYLAQGKPDPVTGKTRTDAVERYLFFHNGREAILTLSGPKGADNVDPWRIITDSLRWTR
jgi:hypothetical protein